MKKMINKMVINLTKIRKFLTTKLVKHTTIRYLKFLDDPFVEIIAEKDEIKLYRIGFINYIVIGKTALEFYAIETDFIIKEFDLTRNEGETFLHEEGIVKHSFEIVYNRLSQTIQLHPKILREKSFLLTSKLDGHFNYVDQFTSIILSMNTKIKEKEAFIKMNKERVLSVIQTTKQIEKDVCRIVKDRESLSIPARIELLKKK